jgi:hypothetical protein
VLLVATLTRSPREADGPGFGRKRAQSVTDNGAGRSGGGPGAAQRVWNTQPAREIVELLI